MRFFLANAKAARVLEPGDGAFDRPASFAASQGSTVLGWRAIEPVATDAIAPALALEKVPSMKHS
jgi:hypothetical protein